MSTWARQLQKLIDAPAKVTFYGMDPAHPDGDKTVYWSPNPTMKIEIDKEHYLKLTRLLITDLPRPGECPHCTPGGVVPSQADDKYYLEPCQCSRGTLLHLTLEKLERRGKVAPIFTGISACKHGNEDWDAARQGCRVCGAGLNPNYKKR